MAGPPLERAGERAAAAGERARLTFRRLSGLDRSGPPPPETMRDAPWRPWTIPNAISYFRLALIPVFLVLALSSDEGTDALPAILFAVVGWGDYADGIAARVTGQYSKLGALLDPVIDRLLVLSGVVVVWHFETLPRWALAVLALREVVQILYGQWALRHGIDLKVNWPGRAAVWPVMSAIFFALVGVEGLAEWLLYVGIVVSIWATILYIRE
ncbi:MAG TPA: CDP-alcohol phosphatidyltransferase family protein, partial [Solirubrobacteraceae bacterium]|nr:CDP-alcohol phosphatidyltransferase family protein [Solirubrobacteraceae bacterium]